MTYLKQWNASEQLAVLMLLRLWLECWAEVQSQFSLGKPQQLRTRAPSAGTWLSGLPQHIVNWNKTSTAINYIFFFSQPMNFNKYTICSSSVGEFSHLLGSNIILEQLPVSLSPIIVLHHLFIMCKNQPLYYYDFCRQPGPVSYHGDDLSKEVYI